MVPGDGETSRQRIGGAEMNTEGSNDQLIMAPNSVTLTTIKWPMNVIFTGLGELAPTDDITPKEAVQLVMMIACASVGSGADYLGFAKSQGLERHFKASRS